MGKIKNLTAVASEKIQRLLARVKELFESKQMSTRDARALKIGVVAVGIFAASLVYRAVFLGDSELSDEVSLLGGKAVQITTLKKEYQRSKELLRRSGGSLKEETEPLLSVAEKSLIRNGIERSSFSIKGTREIAQSIGVENERAIQVQMSNVHLSKVLNVLYYFRDSKTILKVSDVRIKTKFDDPSYADVSFRLSTFSFKESG